MVTRKYNEEIMVVTLTCKAFSPAPEGLTNGRAYLAVDTIGGKNPDWTIFLWPFQEFNPFCWQPNLNFILKSITTILAELNYNKHDDCIN